MANLEFAHILREATKPTIVLTDNKTVARFSKRRQFCQHCGMLVIMLQFYFKKAHIAGSVNTAIEFLSRLELEVTEKIRLKIREDIQTTPIEVTTSSSDVADEEHFSFTQADNNDESEKQTLERKK